MNRSSIMSVVLFLCFSTGCTTLQKPDDLRQPVSVSCFKLPSAISFNEERGLLKIVWETRLERGVYIAEREDDKGTYYRAPPGGIYEGRIDMKDKPAGVLTHVTRDGGLWISRDRVEPPRVYMYISTEEAPKVVPPDDADCASFAVAKDPATAKHGVLAFAAGGALGGAAARSAAPNSAVSYGTAGVGGAIGMGIVAAMINMDVGKIALGAPIQDVAFVSKVREAAERAVLLKELQLVSPGLDPTR